MGDFWPTFSKAET